MQRRIFVLNGIDDAKALADVGIWAANNGGTSTTDPIMAETLETPFVRVTLEYPGGSPPYYPDYTPFSLVLTLTPDEIYTKERETLELAILSAYTSLPIDTVKQSETPSGLDIGFFMHGGEPLWIDPEEWATYVSLLFGSKGMQLISDDPLFEVVLAIAKHEDLKLPSIFKHPLVDVWYGPEAVDLSPYMVDLANVVRITPEAEGTHNRILLDEMIRAYDYKHYQYTVQVPEPCKCLSLPCTCPAQVTYITKTVELKLSGEYYYLRNPDESKSPFDVAWLLASFDTVLEGFIPSVTVRLPETKAPLPVVRHNVIQAYLTTLEKLGSGYLLPQLLEFIQVDNYEDGTLAVSLIVDSKATLDEVLWNMKPYTNFHAQPVDNVDEGLKLRYRLSQAGIPSLLLGAMAPGLELEGSLLDNVVTWEGPPLDQIPALTSSTESAKTALMNYLSMLARVPEDVVSQREFKTLSLTELVDVIVTQWRNAYESETILKLQYLEDPSTRQPLTPKDLVQVGHGAKGFFTVGPLKGLRDHVIMPLPVKPLDGIITTEVYDYFTDTELVAAYEEHRAPVPSEQKQVVYTVAMMDGILLPLLTLLVVSSDIQTVTNLVTKAWDMGVFLSMWSRGYIQSQHIMSDADPVIPYQIRNQDVTRAIAFLKMVASFHT